MNAAKTAGMLVGFIIGLVVIVGIFSLIVQYSWNYVMPSAVGTAKLTFLQALALIILVTVLFGGGFHAPRYF